jgi:multidrug resistance protein MdtO
MSTAPAIDAGNPSGLARVWELMVSPTPGRLENTIRAVLLVLAVVAIGETFRVPEIAISAYVVLFVSRAEAASTAVTALIAGVAVILAIFAAILVLIFSLSQPALRIPLIAGMTFVAMFLARTAGELAPAFFAAGFIIAYGLTLGEEALGISLMPGSVANTESLTLPELAFVPPVEALLQFLLWLALAVAIPVALVIIANLLTGRDPALLLRAALAERLRAAARFCDGEAGADRGVEALAREGTTGLLKLRHLASLLRKAVQLAPVAEIQRLLLFLLALKRAGGNVEGDRLVPVAQFCREAARAIENGAPVSLQAPELGFSGAAQPLGSQITRTLQAIREPPAATHPVTEQPRRLLAPDAFSNPEYTRFALKVSLAVMLAYFAEDMLDWPGIHTIVITCFFVSLGTVGETLHKVTLRLSGCIVGAALGLGTIIGLMPLMTDLGDLLLVVAPVTFLAAWIGFGSERIAYAGWQIGLAFFLSTFQEFGPTLDMQTARDRVVGIILGNIIISVIFMAIWPVSVARVARDNLVKAVEQLAALFRAQEAEAETAHRAGFAEAIGQAQAIMVNEPFETRAVLTADGARPIDAGILAQVQALFVPIAVILDLRREMPQSIEIESYEAALAAWFEGAAAWIRDGSGTDKITQSLPEPPKTNEPVAVWQRLLDQDIHAILARVGPEARAARDVSPGELGLAAR